VCSVRQGAALGREISPSLICLPIFLRASPQLLRRCVRETRVQVHDNTFVYIEGDAPDEAVTIAIFAAERKIAATVIGGCDFSVNYIREFFEAAFFLRSKSETAVRALGC